MLSLCFWAAGCAEIKGNGTDDTDFMNRAIQLASIARGKTHPNPCVGCVIVDANNNIVGEGYHAKAGQDHAEIVALKQAGKLSNGSTVYVSLEPCNHYGRTPPCSMALARHGVARVVTGMVDPDDRVAGRGIQFLRDRGIHVDVGVCEAACKDINRAFVHRILKKLPYSTVWIGVQEHRNVAEPVARMPKCDEISALLFNVAPDTDTLVMDPKSLCSLESVCDWLPEHITIAVDATRLQLESNATSCPADLENEAIEGGAMLMEKVFSLVEHEFRGRLSERKWLLLLPPVGVCDGFDRPEFLKSNCVSCENNGSDTKVSNNVITREIEFWKGKKIPDNMIVRKIVERRFHNDSITFEAMKSSQREKSLSAHSDNSDSDPIAILDALEVLGSNAVVFIAEKSHTVRHFAAKGLLQQLVCSSSVETETALGTQHATETRHLELVDKLLSDVAGATLSLDADIYIQNTEDIERLAQVDKKRESDRIFAFPRVLAKMLRQKQPQIASALFFWRQ